MMASTEVGKAPIGIWSDLGWIRRRVATARRLFLFLDFDGTLAPIVAVPSLAALPKDLEAILRALSTRRDVVTAVVSGRGLDDLRCRVGLPIVYAGNHGLEILGGGLEYTVPEARELRLQLLAVCNRLRVRLEPFPGALIENKRLAASVHVRQVDRAEVPAIRDLVESTMQHYPALRVSDGKEVFEIRPDISWNKGSAARWILQQMEGGEGDAICIGDDSTDEDMFTELKSGITVRVGVEGSTSARYWIANTEVSRFLSFLRDAVEELGPSCRCRRQSPSAGR
jgi:trehalose 6-phosphate phosphatase